LGENFRGISPKIFPRKMYEKSAPVVTYDIVACDKKALCPDLFATGFWIRTQRCKIIQRN
jgi:hypothetical protein